MPGVDEQLDLAIRSIGVGDIDLLSKVLTDPMAITPAEMRTTAQKLGFKDRFLQALVDIGTDPVVWVGYLMSKRFPTLSWLKGTIPTRFIGANNQFNGIGHFTRPVETYFRGTPVPRLVALQQYRESKVREIGAEMLRVMERPNWSHEMPIVSMLMEGQPVAGATPELHRIANELRGRMDRIWKLVSQTKRIRGGFGGDQITVARAEDWPPNMAPKYLRDYLPHFPLLGDSSTIELAPTEALKRMGMGKTAQVLSAAQQNPAEIWEIDQARRLSSSFSRYQMFLNKTQGNVWNPNLFRRMRMNTPLQSLQGQELFVTDLNVILQKYVHSAAKTYALNTPLTPHERALTTVIRDDGTRDIPTSDPIIVQIINRGLQTTGARLERRPVLGTNAVDEVLVRGTENPHALTALQTLVKACRGDVDEGQIWMGNLFASVGAKFDSLAGSVGYKKRLQVDAALKTLQRTKQQAAVENGLVSYFYSTTLGMNPWSAIQNTLQPLITSGPALGIGAALRGMRDVGMRATAYSRAFNVELRALKGVRPGAGNWTHRANEAAQRAFNTVFPELADAGLKLDPRLFEVRPESIQAFGSRARRAFATYDDYAKFMLQPFTHAELINQASTFYGTKHKLRDAMRTGEYEIPLDIAGKPLAGAALEDWLNFEATGVVNATQFRPGPGGRTIFQSKLPAPLRMFQTFPIRAMSFMTESTVRGAMTQKQLESAGLFARVFGGRNWGTLARVALYGRIAQHGAADILDVDLSGATGITSPFTFTPQGEWLSPLPIPPLAGTVIGMASAAANRDISKLKPLVLPGVGEIPWPKALFPGGTAITRAARAVRQFRPELGGWVDDDERLMNTGNGTDLVLSMFGIPLERNRRSRQYLDRIGNVRQRVNQFRRSYAKAYTTLDLDGMKQLEQQWSETFKDWPPLSVTARDARRYSQAARMPMIQRMLHTMGQSGRFLAAEIYEADPEIIGPGEMTTPLMPGGM